jgi:UDP-N-acetylmuramoyl-tripeptide--D-alanyl-D-alanine ligase
VVELGMNHPGEIEKLAAMAQPTVALVNNAQREHLEFMASIEAVANENGAVLKSLASQGIAVFPADDRFSPLWTELARSQQTITFGMDLPTSAGQVTCMRPRWSRNAWDVKAKTIAGGLHFKLRIAGLHNVMNSLAAISCALAAGVPLDMIEQGLEKFEPVKGRSRIQLLTVAGHAITLVDDSYNANPDSVRAAIDVLAGLPGPRLLVLGDMGEVGHEGADLHAEVGGYARQCGIELLYGLGAMTTKAVEQYGAGKHFPDMNALNQATLEVLPKMSSVLVKGSRFMRMEQVVQAILAKTQIEQEKSKASHAN